MFTGIVEIIGTVTAVKELDETASGGGGVSLTITDAKDILADAHLGDSICVNGTCLTITEFSSDSFKLGVSPETLRRTNLGLLRTGSHVNLERAMLGSTRMGGHFVQGHVDTTATILAITPDGNALTFRLQPRDKSLLKYIVEKGYITMDGASLTVTQVKDGDDGWWEVMLIAYTQERVVTASKKVGELVNVEVDMVGKYVEKSVAAYFDSNSGGESGILGSVVSKTIDSKLAERNSK